MSLRDPAVEAFLLELKVDGRSSPRDWQRFFVFLRASKQYGQADPPVPLILAAAGESDASKHRRLAAQLQWATENGCAAAALDWLRRIPVEQWNACPPAQWNQDSYPS